MRVALRGATAGALTGLSLLVLAGPAQAHGGPPLPQGRAAADAYYAVLTSMRADQPVTVETAILSTYGPYLGVRDVRAHTEAVIRALPGATLAQKSCVRDELAHLLKHEYANGARAGQMRAVFTAAQKATRSGKSTVAGYAANQVVDNYLKVGKQALKGAAAAVGRQFAHESSTTLRTCVDQH